MEEVHLLKFTDFFFLLHSATSAYILKHKGRGRFEKESINMKVTELVTKRWLYLLDYSIVHYRNLKKREAGNYMGNNGLEGI